MSILLKLPRFITLIKNIMQYFYIIKIHTKARFHVFLYMGSFAILLIIKKIFTIKDSNVIFLFLFMMTFFEKNNIALNFKKKIYEKWFFYPIKINDLILFDTISAVFLNYFLFTVFLFFYKILFNTADIKNIFFMSIYAIYFTFFVNLFCITKFYKKRKTILTIMYLCSIFSSCLFLNYLFNKPIVSQIIFLLLIIIASKNISFFIAENIRLCIAQREINN